MGQLRLFLGSKLNDYFLIGAGGQNTATYVTNVIAAAGYALIVGGGAWLIFVGGKDFIAGMSSQTKDVKKIVLGLLTVVAGGALILLGFNGFKTLANNLGADFNFTS